MFDMDLIVFFKKIKKKGKNIKKLPQLTTNFKIAP